MILLAELLKLVFYILMSICAQQSAQATFCFHQRRFLAHAVFIRGIWLPLPRLRQLIAYVSYLQYVGGGGGGMSFT